MTLRLLVGTYARDGGAGLHSLRWADDAWVLGDVYADAQNASFGTYSHRHDLYYFVDEQPDGALGAYREIDGRWEQLARVATGGAEPCYVALDRDQGAVAVANYGSGSIALFPLDGVPRVPGDMRHNSGSGPVEDRQDGPHAHCVCFGPDQRWLYHVDLGTDEILAHRVTAPGSLGERSLAYRAPAGSGPRHLVFHPTEPRALLVSELASTLTVLDVEGDKLAPRQTISTLPADAIGDSLGGQLTLNAAGDRAYVTNRGHDSIAVFAWDEAGALELLQHVPSGGASPRSFVLLEDERQLVLANEEGGNVTAFDLRPDGTLARRDTDIAVPGAVFLLVAPE